MSEFAGDLPDRRRSKMNKIAVNAFIHGGALSDPIELNPNFENDVLAYLTYPSRLSAILRATYTPLADAWERECVTPLPSPMI